MEPRIDFSSKTASEAARAMMGLENYVNRSELEHSLIELVRTRVSQINGCAFCIDMHTKDARAAGETEQRLYGLSAWREAPLYTGRERAALEWAEELTLISSRSVPDKLYGRVREHFSEAELASLTIAVISINGWNRINIGFRAVPKLEDPAAAVL